MTDYISTLSLMIFLLLFSIFSASVSGHKAINSFKEKQHNTLRISMGFSLFEVGAKEQAQDMMFDAKSYSLSATSMIHILMCWQLFVFNLVARRE